MLHSCQYKNKTHFYDNAINTSIPSQCVTMNHALAGSTTESGSLLITSSLSFIYANHECLRTIDTWDEFILLYLWKQNPPFWPPCECLNVCVKRCAREKSPIWDAFYSKTESCVRLTINWQLQKRYFLLCFYYTLKTFCQHISCIINLKTDHMYK